VVSSLLESGLLVDEKDSQHDWTPLHYAVLNKHEDLALWLLDKGADPASVDKEGFTPIFSAVSVNSLQLTQALLRYKRGWHKTATKLKLTHLAATQPTSSILEYLHQEGFSLSEEDNAVTST
jgi:ankyrin repeat protein